MQCIFCKAKWANSLVISYLHSITSADRSYIKHQRVYMSVSHWKQKTECHKLKSCSEFVMCQQKWFLWNWNLCWFKLMMFCFLFSVDSLLMEMLAWLIWLGTEPSRMHGLLACRVMRCVTVVRNQGNNLYLFLIVVELPKTGPGIETKAFYFR